MNTVDPVGTGIAYPPQLDAHGDWGVLAGEALLAADVVALLLTAAASQTEAGEIPWDGQRGTTLARMVHRTLPLALSQAWAEQLILGALQRDEPRVQGTRVEAEADVHAQALHLRVRYLPVFGGSIQTATLTL